MLSKLSFILQNDCQLDHSRPIIVGVSGGPDSLCLLDVLGQLGYPRVIAHFNHQLRPEASADADTVRQISETLRVPFVLAERDVAAYAASHGLSIEDAARLLRYTFLFAQAEAHQAQAVAVAHTADDQVETVLMHLLRGAGLAGLSGMQMRTQAHPWSTRLPLIRPLLNVWRSEVLAYCQEHHLQPVMDASNLDPTFFRNRLRHELIPYLENYNPGIRQTLWRTTQTLHADYETIQSLCEVAWSDCVVAEDIGCIAIQITSFQRQQRAIQRMVLRKAITNLCSGIRDVGFDTIERILAFLEKPSRSGTSNLAAGLSVRHEGDLLWLASWYAHLPNGNWPQTPAEALILPVPGTIRLAHGWHITAEPVYDIAQAIIEAQANVNPFRAWISLDGLDQPLVVRDRHSGDRLQPLGLDGHWLKLSDFFINVKVPQRARQRWPLVCAGENIAWVPGYRLAHAFRLTTATHQAALLTVQQN